MKKIFYLAVLLTVFSTNAQNPGEIDTSFNIDANNIDVNFFGVGYSIVPLSDGTILSSGYYFSISDDAIPYEIQRGIIKVNNDGSIDYSFNTEGIGTAFTVYTSDFVSSIVVQEDGKIVIGGIFDSYNNAPNTAKIVRLNSDGSLDYSFNVGQFFPYYYSVKSLAIQPDGKILAAGNFEIDIDDDNSYHGIFRANTDGSVDTTFNTGTGFNERAQSIALQEDGKIIVGGMFTEYNGQSHNRIVRLNEDGSVDTTFNTGTGFNELAVHSIALQEDGKIIVGGRFTEYNGQPYNRIIRLNTDGSIDTSFNIGTGFNLVMHFSSITIQPNGKILAGGTFTEYNGQPHKGIIRLNTDGSVDTSFNSGTGFNGMAAAIALQSDGKILIIGNFNTYNGQPTGSMVRLHGDGSLDVANFDTQHNVAMYPNPANDIVTITNIPDNSTINIIDITGKLIYNSQVEDKQATIDITNLISGIYLVQVTDSHKKTIKRLIIQ